jgi:transcriptional regulator with XRE-family HTH domain
MVGPLVKSRREARGLTQTELAERTGLRQTYISQVEGGEIVMPRDHNLDKLGAVLGIGRGEFYRAAGMLDGIEATNGNGKTGPPPFRPEGDYTPAEVAAIIDWVEALPGEAHRREIAAERAAQSPEDFAQFCLDTHGAWMSNLRLGINQARRARARNGVG